MRSVVQVYSDPPFFIGAIAQLGERLLCTQEVRSSILLGSTNRRLREASELFLRHLKKYYCVKEIYLVEAQDESVREFILNK